ncbi:TonB-dependent receptor plug domain-containing protein [Sphingomonas sp. CBMAI 2297]|uniref:TonB-dependent receptor n=1 Tax=Sphingomonas sp. CBMAI 2297 TaxID=2991720 RepID=UPI002453B854|nr:TonB-dependent receptor [Sphingomonas sp. CBMAI 2297]MDH4746211.1 TonB-dependent receptor plug domain-containing protein [Sphingomonas sp. CBMAI 2297]
MSDIVVTGTRRETRLQDTDVSVTVLDRKTLDAARIRDVRQLDAVVPNVQFNESGQLGSTFISIRGIESNPFIINRAAVYIDGIPFRELSNAVLNQVETIEVLRGPQATLYGANSESGLIVINTRAPTDHVVAEARATGAAYRGGVNGAIDGFLGGPLAGDRLAGSLAWKAEQGDSFLANRRPGAPAGSLRTLFLQGRLRWRPTDRLTLNGTAYILDKHAPGIFDQQYVPLDVDLYNRTYADRFNGGRRIGKFSSIEDAPKLTNQREIVAGVSARYDLGYGALDAAVSYRHYYSDAKGLDFDFTALPTAAGEDRKARDFYNAELRFSSPASKPFNYIIGVTHYRDDNDRFQTTFAGPGTLDSYKPAPHQYSHARDWGVFASANWSPLFLPKVTLSGGIRYDHAHRAAKQNAGQLDLGGGNFFIYRDAELAGDFHAALPRFSVRYAPSSRLTFYASSSKGYIPGGFNLTAAQANLPNSVLRYASETMWSHEGGFKWRSADGRLRLAGAGFYIRSNNWQEIQVATDATGRIISSDYIGASASIDSKGFELEASAEPVRGLSFIANIGYADARYRDLQIDATTNARGRRVKLVPAYDGYLAVRYQRPDGLFGRAELSLKGKELLNSGGAPVQPATQTVGLQLGYDGPRWSARAFVDNLTDVRRASGLAFRNLAFGNDGNWYAPVSRGRQAGIELAWKL